MAQELIANSAVPGTEPPIGTLTALLATAAAGSTGTIKTQAVALPALQVAGGQYRIRIDSELLLVTGGQTTITHNVVRGIEGTTPTTHASNAPIFHELTVGALQNLAVSLAQLPPTVVRADPQNLGASVSGNVALNLAAGHVCILSTVAPGITFLQPTNAPVSTPSYLEVWVFGTSPISWFTGLKWVGEAPTTDLTGGLNVYMLVTLDGSSWYGLAGGSIPANVLRVSPTGPEQTVEYDGAKWHVVPRAPTVGEVNGLISTAMGTVPGLVTSAISSGASLGSICLGTGPNATAWTLIEYPINETAQGRMAVSDPISATQTISGPAFPMAIVKNSKVATLSERAVAEILVGQIVTGTSIPGSTVVAAKLSATTIELSREITATSRTTLASFAWRNALIPVIKAGINLTLEANALLGGQVWTVANLSNGNVNLIGRFIFRAVTETTTGSKAAVIPGGAPVVAGMDIVMPGLPIGTKVESVTDAEHIVLTNAATTGETTTVAQYDPRVTPSTSTFTLGPEETATFISTVFSSLQPSASYRTRSALEALIRSIAADPTFTAVTLNGPAVKQAEGITAWPCGVRLENGGASARLRGVFQINAAESLATNGKAFTIPSGFRVTSTNEGWLRTTKLDGTPVILEMQSSGNVKLHTAGLVAGDQVILDGLTYSLA